MATVSIAENRVLRQNVSWATYVALVNESTGGRMTYDRGMLEIMSPSKPHEKIGCLIGRLVETYTEVRNIDIESVASTTFKRADLERGFEADESYYLRNASRVRDKEEIDLTMDPPPDLVIEVDISRSSLDKLGIFSSLGVPEVWRHDGSSLKVYTLRGSGYVESDTSEVLPGFPFQKLEEVVASRSAVGETDLIRRFRAWLEQNP